MTDFATTIERLRAISSVRGGMAELHKKSGVPVSTIVSFAKRDWTHKNIATIVRLAEAVEKIDAEQKA